MATTQVIPPPPPGFTLDDATPPPAGFTLDANQDPPVTIGEEIAGHPATRLAMGAASPVIGGAQLLAHGVDALSGGKGTPHAISAGLDEAISNYEKAKKRGMKYWDERMQLFPTKKLGLETPDVDVAGFVGQAMSGTGLAKALPMGASALGRIAEGGTAGALVGATTPITESADNPGFFKEKAMQTGLGALTGGVIPAIMETGKALGRVGGEIGDLFWTEGPSNIVTRYQRKIVGEQNVPAVQTALKNVQQYVEGSKPTAAEALVGTIEGSPIQSHQKFIASQPGGSSAAFGERVSANQQAREVAHDVTDGLMTERLHEIFDAANKKGGVKTPNIQYALFDVSKMPGIRNTPLERTFDSMRERIQGLSGKSLRADARDIYSVWKDLDKIAASSGTDVAKKNAVQAAQKVIDEVLEKSAGVKWVEFKSVHNAQMKNIAADIERFAEQYKPVQKTRLGGAKLEKGEIESLPHMLSRPLVIGNWALKILKGDIEPAVVAEASRRYLNPKDMARALDLKPAMITPEVWESLVRSASVSGATAAAHAKYSKQGKEAAKAIGSTP